MSSLSRSTLPETAPEYEKVEVPEFGQDDEGKPLYVNVRGLSVHDWNMMFRAVRSLRPDLSQNGSRGSSLPVTAEYDEICLVAASCSYDDSGHLVFGVNVDEALEMVMGLSGSYWPAVLRIYSKVMAMSRHSWVSEQAIEEAEKN